MITTNTKLYYSVQLIFSADEIEKYRKESYTKSIAELNEVDEFTLTKENQNHQFGSTGRTFREQLNVRNEVFKYINQHFPNFDKLDWFDDKENGNVVVQFRCFPKSITDKPIDLSHLYNPLP